MNLDLLEYLNLHNIPYNEHFHPAVFTVEESKKLHLNIPGLHTKNLFLKSSQGFYLVCLEADKKLDMKLLKSKLGVKDLSFGSPDELKSELCVSPGSVSLFALIHSKNTTLVLDKKVWDAEVTGFHPNVNTSTLEITHDSLAKFYGTLKCKKLIIDLG